MQHRSQDVHTCLLGNAACIKRHRPTCDALFNQRIDGKIDVSRLTKDTMGEDLTLSWKPVRVIGGGKSGAIVLMVEPKKGRSEVMFMKLYLDAFDLFGDVYNERPFRELYSQCILGGEQGFTCTGCFGVAKWPVSWIGEPTSSNPKPVIDSDLIPNSPPPRLLYMIFTKASGVPLMDLDLSSLNYSQLFGTALEITARWQRANAVVGPGFTHWDFHPENIFVDFTKPARDSFALPVPIAFPIKGNWRDETAFKKVKLDFPSVTIIDFDLVSSSIFPDLLQEHIAKINSPFGVTERALQWIMKWLPPAVFYQWLGFLTLFHKILPHAYANEDWFHLVSYQFICIAYGLKNLNSDLTIESIAANTINYLTGVIADIAMGSTKTSDIVSMMTMLTVNYMFDPKATTKPFITSLTPGDSLPHAATEYASTLSQTVTKVMAGYGIDISDIVPRSTGALSQLSLENSDVVNDFEKSQYVKNVMDTFPSLANQRIQIGGGNSILQVDNFDGFDASRTKVNGSDVSTIYNAISSRLSDAQSEFLNKTGHYITMDNVKLSISRGDIAAPTKAPLCIQFMLAGSLFYIELFNADLFNIEMSIEKLMDFFLQINKTVTIWTPIEIDGFIGKGIFLVNLAQETKDDVIKTLKMVEPGWSHSQIEKTHTPISLAKVRVSGLPLEIRMSMSWDIRYNRLIQLLIGYILSDAGLRFLRSLFPKLPFSHLYRAAEAKGVAENIMTIVATIPNDDPPMACLDAPKHGGLYLPATLDCLAMPLIQSFIWGDVEEPTMPQEIEALIEEVKNRIPPFSLNLVLFEKPTPTPKSNENGTRIEAPLFYLHFVNNMPKLSLYDKGASSKLSPPQVIDYAPTYQQEPKSVKQTKPNFIFSDQLLNVVEEEEKKKRYGAIPVQYDASLQMLKPEAVIFTENRVKLAQGPLNEPMILPNGGSIGLINGKWIIATGSSPIDLNNRENENEWKKYDANTFLDMKSLQYPYIKDQIVVIRVPYKDQLYLGKLNRERGWTIFNILDVLPETIVIGIRFNANPLPPPF